MSTLIKDETKDNIVEPESEEQENQDEYCEGGYHTVKIGDLFHDKYKIVRKLGFGTSATVWRCENLDNKDHVALKIMKSSPSYTKSAKNEIKILKTIQLSENNDPHREKIVKLLDDFTVSGVNGSHVCLVFEILNHDLLQLVQTSKNFNTQLPIVKNIIKQIFEGLNYLHTKCNIIHTDIKLDNILISKQICPDQPDAFEFSVKIADFGNSHFANHNLNECIQTRPYRCPEVLLGAGFSFAADIWSAACMVFEIVVGDVLFDSYFNKEYMQDKDHMERIFALTGEGLMSMAVKGIYFDEFFTQDGELHHVSKVNCRGLMEKLTEDYNWAVDESRELADFLKPLLAFDPQFRTTAQDCIKHKYLQS